MEWLVNTVRPFQFPGKARLLQPFVPISGMRSAVVYGYRVQLDLSEHIQRMIYLGAYERWETKVCQTYLRPGMCFVDVGANVGYFSLLAARRVGSGGRVYAIEPSNVASDRLSKTLVDNQLQNISLQRCALGRSAGDGILYDSLPDNHAPSMVSTEGTSGRRVQVRTLDELADAIGVTQIDLLKIDVEGYEPEVIAGGQNLFATGRIRALLCEFNEFWLVRNGTSGEALYQRILEYGFIDQTDVPFARRPQLECRFFVLPKSPAKSLQDAGP